MRLDEWQKFIESQFLEETTARPTPAKPAAAPTVESQTVLLLEGDLLALDEIVEEPEKTPPLSPATLLVENGAGHADAEKLPRTERQPVQTTPRQTGFVVRSVVEPPTEAPPPLMAVSPVPRDTIPEADVPIPVFADYLPSKSADPVSAPIEAPEAAPFRAEDALSGPMSVLAPLTTGFTPVNTVPVRPTPVEGNLGPAEQRRRRAPQARNVQPETVASGISAADLWAQVPRHVQTLLALERREEEREVAQSSYKRPFQEKRAELIARILDPVLSLEDTARLLNVCPTTVRRYTNKGILTHIRKETAQPSANTSERETRQRRFRLSDILTFLETQQSALEADRLQERVAPSRRKRPTPPLEPANQD